MTDFTELQSETREIIADLLNDGSDPAALYIIEHHVAHDNFDLLEKIALDAFKMGYEVSEAEEFEDDDGKPLFCFDIISEVELKAEIIDAQQKEILPLIERHQGVYDGWGTYFEDPNADEDEYGNDGEFFDEEDEEDRIEIVRSFFYGEMMKLKTLSLALLAFSFVLSARADANAAQPNNVIAFNVIAFNVEAERQIERDLMQVNLFYQSEGKNLSELNKTVNTRLNKAIGIAKQYPAVEIQGNTRNTMVQYDGKGKQSGWLARVELMLESKDSQALSDVINALDDTLAIENISASVSDEKLTHVENELTQAVLEKFKNKALLIQNTLQMKNYRVMDLNISAANEHNYAPVYYEPTAKSALTLSESASNAVPLENGKETVRMRVEGRIELLSD